MVDRYFYISDCELGKYAMAITLDPNAKRPVSGKLYNKDFPNGRDYEDTADLVGMTTGFDSEAKNVKEKEFKEFIAKIKE